MSRLRRTARLVAWVTGVASAVPGAARADTLPQMDFANVLTTYQVLWGAVIFLILYILASRTALPKVAAVLEARAERIAGDLEDAVQTLRRLPPVPGLRPNRSNSSPLLVRGAERTILPAPCSRSSSNTR